MIQWGIQLFNVNLVLDQYWIRKPTYENWKSWIAAFLLIFLPLGLSLQEYAARSVRSNECLQTSQEFKKIKQSRRDEPPCKENKNTFQPCWLNHHLRASVCVRRKTTPPSRMHTQLMSEIPHHARPLQAVPPELDESKSCPVIKQKYAKSNVPLTACLSHLLAQKQANLIHVNLCFFTGWVLKAKQGEENRIYLQIIWSQFSHLSCTLQPF